MSTDRLGPAERDAAAARMWATTPDSPLDVLVVGGGVVGCGAALDAAARGLSVGLVEMRDLASGTSSRSSRLAHGGLRYLEQREFALVHEALTERGLLLDRLAPHLCRPVPMLFPVEHSWERPYVGAGITLYDLMSRVGAYGGTMPRPRTLSRVQVAGLAPGLRSGVLAGAVRFYDAQIDDARHTLALARTAAGRGAAILTRARVVGLLRDGEQVVGAQVRDDETGRTSSVYARVVLGAAGVWSDELRTLLGASGGPSEVRQSKGVHLVVPGTAIRSTLALIARTEKSVLFLLPWGRHWLIGTTDTDWEGDLAEPTIEPQDVEYLLAHANRWLARPLDHDDVIGVYAGLRPLISTGSAEGDAASATLSREHAVFHPTPGMVLIAGGKYTTYRVMARDVVDAAAAELVAQGHDEIAESTTEEIPLVGAADFSAQWSRRVQTAAEAGLPVEIVEHLLRRHGDRTSDVLDLVADDPSLGELLHPDERYLRAEVVLAASHEGAQSLVDVLVRRLRVALETRDSAVTVAGDAARLMAAVLGWDEHRVLAEVGGFASSRPLLPRARDLAAY
jgi:glycerol-3-phosphate dehydrogenase